MKSGVYDYSKLRGLIREKKCTQEDVATAAGLNPATLSQKLSGKSLFKQSEISAICDALEILPQDIATYFFAS